MSETLFGELNSESITKQNAQCRDVVREISMFGVSQRQILLIMYLLAMELENNDQMITITSTIKQLVGNTLFVKQEECDG